MSFGTDEDRFEYLLTHLVAIWVSWWGNGVGHSSDSLGYWLGIFVLLAVTDVLFIMSSIGYATVATASSAS